MVTMHLTPVPGYENSYAVGEDCHVYSLVTTGGVNSKRLTPLPMKYFLSKRGYYTVKLSKNSSQKRYFVHRIVMLALVGPSELDVNHMDGNKTNNHISNLEYVTRKENIVHAISIGLRKPFPDYDRSKVRQKTRFSDAEILEIREACSKALDGRKRFPHKSLQGLASRFGVHKSDIRKIFLRLKYKHLP